MKPCLKNQEPGGKKVVGEDTQDGQILGNFGTQLINNSNELEISLTEEWQGK